MEGLIFYPSSLHLCRIQVRLGCTDDHMRGVFAVNMLLLPARANIPSWDDALKIQHYYGVTTLKLAIRMDVCVNSCVIFFPNNILLGEGVVRCPHCQEHRYVSMRSKISRLYFYWFQPLKQLLNMYLCAPVAKKLVLSASQPASALWEVSDIQTSPLWKDKVLDSGFAAVRCSNYCQYFTIVLLLYYYCTTIAPLT